MAVTVGDVVTDTATGMSGKLIAVTGNAAHCQVVYNIANSKADFVTNLDGLIVATPQVEALVEALAVEEGWPPVYL